jgi:hypothetical protein
MSKFHLSKSQMAKKFDEHVQTLSHRLDAAMVLLQHAVNQHGPITVPEVSKLKTSLTAVLKYDSEADTLSAAIPEGSQKAAAIAARDADPITSLNQNG